MAGDLYSLYVIPISRKESTPRDLRSELGVTVAGSTPQVDDLGRMVNRDLD